jgi:hypothetical protein
MTKMLYIGQGRRRPKGWLLAHNHILHGKNTRNGVNGFRYFWIASREGRWKLCRCGWRPDLGPHYTQQEPEARAKVRKPALDLSDIVRQPLVEYKIHSGTCDTKQAREI